MSTESPMDLGPQPLDALLTTHALENRDLMAVAPEGVTFKVLGKARKGRRITARMQRKVLAAVNACLKQRELARVEFAALFNYIGP